MPVSASAAVGRGRDGLVSQVTTLVHSGPRSTPRRAGAPPMPGAPFHVHTAQPPMAGSPFHRSTWRATFASVSCPNSPIHNGRSWRGAGGLVAPGAPPGARGAPTDWGEVWGGVGG